HHPFPGDRAQKQPQGLCDAGVPVDVPQRAAGVGHQREDETATGELAHPMVTVPAPPTTLAASTSVGSLQVRTGSPRRAAALPLIGTPGDPPLTVPRFDGGRWNAVPGGIGRCGGTLRATEPFVAAPCPSIRTSEEVSETS